MKNRRKKRRLPECGTAAGYAAHIKSGTWLCDRCVVASETYNDDERRTLLYDLQDWIKDQHLWSTYQLSLTRFAQIFAEQGNRCACCLRTDPGDGAWNIDHDHRTGLIRGILCTRCNTGLGQLGDDIEGLERALTYLRAHEARGGHAKASERSTTKTFVPKPSAIMERSFALFRQGVPRDQIVVIMRLKPDTVEAMHALWSTLDGTVSKNDLHLFQTAKDGSCQFLCTCGHAEAWGKPDEISAAIERMNGHIKEAAANRQSAWDQLAAEEKQLRIREEQQKKSERQRAVMDDLRRTNVLRD